MSDKSGTWNHVKIWFDETGHHVEEIQNEDVFMDKVTVGDLDSSARGSGARKNGGKPQWHQLPLFALDGVGRVPVFRATSFDVIRTLGQWQQRSPDGDLTKAIAQLLFVIAPEADHERAAAFSPPLQALASTVRVLEFGAAKYKVGNWAKGMPWSVCLSCAVSHLFKYAGGEDNDEESGLPHLAHAMCNLLFLKSYETLYPEGDDRIPEFAVTRGTVDIADEVALHESYSDPDYWAPMVVTGDHA